MDPEEVIAFLHTALGLKRIPRTGWLLRGLWDVESVADHTWGVTMVVLALVPGVPGPLDLGKALTIALIHDLPERVLSDIPSPALDLFPAGAKTAAEGAALARIVGRLPDASRLLALWREFDEASSPEGLLVRDADRLEMLVQAFLYEEARGVRLDEFWANQSGRPFHFAVSQALYEALIRRRESPRTVAEGAG